MFLALVTPTWKAIHLTFTAREETKAGGYDSNHSSMKPLSKPAIPKHDREGESSTSLITQMHFPSIHPKANHDKLHHCLIKGQCICKTPIRCDRDIRKEVQTGLAICTDELSNVRQSVEVFAGRSLPLCS